MLSHQMFRALVQHGKLISQRTLATSAITNSNIQVIPTHKDKAYPKIGNREIVGFGVNGSPTYQDREEYPFPAVRFREDNDEIISLREKEKGDWKKLSIEDKKTLYRASFCQTYAEMKAPTGEWRSIAAGVLFGLAMTGWVMIYLKTFVYPELPRTITPEWQEAQLENMIKLRQGHVNGPAAKWDYEKNEWK